MTLLWMNPNSNPTHGSVSLYVFSCLLATPCIHQTYAHACTHTHTHATPFLVRDWICYLKLWFQSNVNESIFLLYSLYLCKNISNSKVVEYKSKKRRKRERQKIADVEKGATTMDDVTIWNNVLHVPPIPPTGLGRCKLIDISYELEVRHSHNSSKGVYNISDLILFSYWRWYL